MVLYNLETGADRTDVPDRSLGAIQCIRGGTLDTPGAPELYNRDRDRAELNNVIDDYPDVANELELKLRRFMDRLVWK